MCEVSDHRARTLGGRNFLQANEGGERREREREPPRRGEATGTADAQGGREGRGAFCGAKYPRRIFNGRLIPNLEEGNAAVFSTAGKSVGPYKFRAETGRALESVGKPPPAKGTGTSTL